MATMRLQLRRTLVRSVRYWACYATTLKPSKKEGYFFTIVLCYVNRRCYIRCTITSMRLSNINNVITTTIAIIIVVVVIIIPASQGGTLM